MRRVSSIRGTSFPFVCAMWGRHAPVDILQAKQLFSVPHDKSQEMVSTSKRSFVRVGDIQETHRYRLWPC